ncbi:hypothetical protein Anapl_12464 [Anas platyrhynchos]|uniref:Uncharacterized protein n=1 Tax=Anas platyrhynchos TaxID=8839 RepID=R0JFB1_ANAPL|nr:hypothetical protein Anapl_12464 [Anas platyrhynchos]
MNMCHLQPQSQNINDFQPFPPEQSRTATSTLMTLTQANSKLVQDSAQDASIANTSISCPKFCTRFQEPDSTSYGSIPLPSCEF